MPKVQSEQTKGVLQSWNSISKTVLVIWDVCRAGKISTEVNIYTVLDRTRQICTDGTTNKDKYTVLLMSLEQVLEIGIRTTIRPDLTYRSEL